MILLSKLSIAKNEKIILDSKFEKLMLIYSFALEKAKEYGEILQHETNIEIVTVQDRIKTPQSIIQKMNKKGYNLNYKNLINYINDIAGVRIVCATKEDVYKIVEEICQIEEINILNKKDYIKNPKKSGYTAYHIIIEVPVYLNKNKILVKVEIQVRTIEMDSWANSEHETSYKPDIIDR